MVDYVLWRRLTKTDFNAMHGKASPRGDGGGAMHISLGVRTDKFPIGSFLRSRGRTTVVLKTAPLRASHPSGKLTFATNPRRRGGEWLIRDQYSHRHPAWSRNAGFPAKYDRANSPYILVFRVDGEFHVRFSTARKIASLALSLPGPMVSASKGIAPTTRALLRRFQINSRTVLEAFKEETRHALSEKFNPRDVKDGRRRVFKGVYRRQGQQAFRRRLMKAYGARCAITRKRTEWVLEAAHITPYMGSKTNTLANGLLLRADIHTLFDLALISIEPDRRKIRVSKMLSGTEYSRLDGKRLVEPLTVSSRPSTAALGEHFSDFQS